MATSFHFMEYVFTNFRRLSHPVPFDADGRVGRCYTSWGAARLSQGQLVKRGENMADEDVQAELARLRAENETLRQKRNSAVSMKVSEKGAVSVYGLGRFPVTLYQEQWQKLLALAEEIKAFIEENRSKLKVKE
jgi:hypothetical protein